MRQKTVPHFSDGNRERPLADCRDTHALHGQVMAGRWPQSSRCHVCDTGETGLQVYLGAVPWMARYVSTAILKEIRSGTRASEGWYERGSYMLQLAIYFCNVLFNAVPFYKNFTLYICGVYPRSRSEWKGQKLRPETKSGLKFLRKAPRVLSPSTRETLGAQYSSVGQWIQGSACCHSKIIRSLQ